MKRFLLLSLAACCFLTASAQLTNKTMTVGSATRQYRQYLPSGFNPSTEPGLPLVIAMHGLGDNYINFSNTGFHYLADTARFLVIYPNGTVNGFGQNSWNNGTLLSSAADDITYISRIIDSMYVSYNIDLSKVYVCGLSMGGIMTYHALCALPTRFAAIASVAGPMSTSDYNTCNPGRAVPVMHIHGTADGTIAYSGSPLPSLTLPTTTIAFWQDNNGCTDSTVTALPNTVPGDSITNDLINYNMCTEPVQLWRENNADHIWPYPPVNDISATLEIWLFFRTKQHPAPSMVSVEEDVLQNGMEMYTTANGLQLTSPVNIEEIVVTDMQGRNLVNLKGNLGTIYELGLNAYQNQTLIVSARTGSQKFTRKLAWVR